MREAAGAGFATATDLADWLVREAGLPFREAHHVDRPDRLGGRRSADVALEALPLDEMQAVHPKITQAVFGVLTVEASVAEPHQLRRHGARECARRGAGLDERLAGKWRSEAKCVSADVGYSRGAAGKLMPFAR